MNHHTTSRNILSIVQAAMIAALYIVLTALAAGFDLASGAIQVRFSEVLTILPFFTPAAIPGVTIGCLLANILTGSALPDIIFGTLATLLGALGTYALRKHRFLCPHSPDISSAVSSSAASSSPPCSRTATDCLSNHHPVINAHPTERDRYSYTHLSLPEHGLHH